MFLVTKRQTLFTFPPCPCSVPSPQCPPTRGHPPVALTLPGLDPTARRMSLRCSLQISLRWCILGKNTSEAMPSPLWDISGQGPRCPHVLLLVMLTVGDLGELFTSHVLARSTSSNDGGDDHGEVRAKDTNCAIR